MFQVDAVGKGPATVKKNILPCILDDATQRLMKFIFNNDMFKEAMESMNLGVISSQSICLG